MRNTDRIVAEIRFLAEQIEISWKTGMMFMEGVKDLNELIKMATELKNKYELKEIDKSYFNPTPNPSDLVPSDQKFSP